MKYALVNGELQEAKPGLNGQCKNCESTVIAKCGEIKIHHWAHKLIRKCDKWWENETEWHRAWKNQFPKEWQEVSQRDEHNERHIADVKTGLGYVIELQHSPINAEERHSREKFYKKMVWVVDGSRLSQDKIKFHEVMNGSMIVNGEANQRRIVTKLSMLLSKWIGSTVPVIFDFNEPILWLILPKTAAGRLYAFNIEREKFISIMNSISNNDEFGNQINKYIESIEKDENSLRWRAQNMTPLLLRNIEYRDEKYDERGKMLARPLL